MIGQYASQFEQIEGQGKTLPEGLLSLSEGVEETDLCEAEVAVERYSYGGLMGMGGMRRAGGKMRKKPVLLLDPEEHEKALRQLDAVAIQDFGESMPSSRLGGMSGLSPLDEVSQVGAEVAPAQSADLAPDTPAVSDFDAIEHEMMDAEPELLDPSAAEFAADEEENVSVGKDSASAWLSPMQPDEIGLEDEYEDAEEGFDEPRYGSLFAGPLEAAEPSAEELRPEGPATPAPAKVTAYEPVVDAPAVATAPTPLAQADYVSDLHVGAATEDTFIEPLPAVPVRPAPHRTGHALRARVDANRATHEPEKVSLIERLFAWFSGLLRG